MDKFGGDGGRKVMEFIAKLLMFSDLKTILLSHGMKWRGGHEEKVAKVETNPLQMTKGSGMVYIFFLLYNKSP